MDCRTWDRNHKTKPLGDTAHDLVERFVQLLPKGAPFLDAGCGRARNSFALVEAGFRVYGCDFSPVALGVARGAAMLQGGGPGFVLSDLTALAFIHNMFNGILCTHVLPYLYRQDINNALNEFWRILSPGGWLYFDLLACDDMEYGCGPELEPETFLDGDGVPVHFSSQQEVKLITSTFRRVMIERIELRSGDRQRIAWSVWANK